MTVIVRGNAYPVLCIVGNLVKYRDHEGYVSVVEKNKCLIIDREVSLSV